MSTKVEKSEVLMMKRTSWTPPMDRYFINLMLDQVHDGQYIEGNFTKNAWKCMTEKFKQRFGLEHTTDTLKNHYRAFKKNYGAIQHLLNVDSGFGWDYDRECVKADDTVWDDYLKAHPDYRQWRTKSMSNYEDLCTIFRDGGATGKYSLATEEKAKNGGKTNLNHVEKVNKEPRVVLDDDDDIVNETQQPIHLDDEEDIITLPKTTQSTTPSSQPTRKRRRTGEGMVDAIHGMASAISQMANKKESQSSISTLAPILILEGKVVSALGELSDIDNTTYFRALEFFEDEKMAKIFVEVPLEKRKGWLDYKLNVFNV